MFEQLTSLVKEYAGDAIITNPSIPNEKNDEAVGMASSSIIDTLKQAVANGDLSQVKQFFSNNEQTVADADITHNIKNSFVDKLVKQLGLDHGKAGQIANALIPVVLSKLLKKTNDSGDSSFSLPGILGSLTGGNVGDMLGKLGGDNGGLMDKMKGFFN